MPGLSDYTCEGEVTIGSVSMNCPAWALSGDEEGDGTLFDLITLIEQRGEDRILPTAGGVIAYPRRITVTEQKLRLVVVGDVDRFGVENSNHTVGLQTNLSYLMANVVAPVASSTGTRTLTYTTPAGSALSGPVHVTKIKRKKQALGFGAMWIGDMTVSIPAGALT